MLDNTGKTYLLRWRFDYKDKASVIGMWNSSHIKAWDKNCDSVIRASIESKDRETSIIRTMAECDGHVFRNFQWHAVAGVPLGFSGSITPRTVHVGLKILTTDQEVLVLINGQIGRRYLTEEEKSIPFVTFGR